MQRSTSNAIWTQHIKLNSTQQAELQQIQLNCNCSTSNAIWTQHINWMQAELQQMQAQLHECKLNSQMQAQLQMQAEHTYKCKQKT